jgi:hypothetical protein
MQRRAAGIDTDMGQFWRREGGTCSRRFCIPLRSPRAPTPPASGYNQHETVRHCTAAAYTREAPRKPARLARPPGLKTNSEFAGKIRSRPTHSRGLAQGNMGSRARGLALSLAGAVSSSQCFARAQLLGHRSGSVFEYPAANKPSRGGGVGLPTVPSIRWLSWDAGYEDGPTKSYKRGNSRLTPKAGGSKSRLPSAHARDWAGRGGRGSWNGAESGGGEMNNPSTPMDDVQAKREIDALLRNWKAHEALKLFEEQPAVQKGLPLKTYHRLMQARSRALCCSAAVYLHTALTRPAAGARVRRRATT